VDSDVPQAFIVELAEFPDGTGTCEFETKARPKADESRGEAPHPTARGFRFRRTPRLRHGGWRAAPIISRPLFRTVRIVVGNPRPMHWPSHEMGSRPGSGIEEFGMTKGKIPHVNLLRSDEETLSYAGYDFITGSNFSVTHVVLL
jgi:hypothetical protein